MKKIILLAYVIISNLFNAQELSPVIGLRYTGGLQYKADHEYPSVEIGLMQEGKKMSGIFTVEVLNDWSKFYSNQKTNTERDLYGPYNSKFGIILRGQAILRVHGSLGLSTFMGVGGTIEKSPAPLTTFGFGLTTLDLPFCLGINYERIMDSNYASIQLYFKLNKKSWR